MTCALTITPKHGIPFPDLGDNHPDSLFSQRLRTRNAIDTDEDRRRTIHRQTDEGIAKRNTQGMYTVNE